MKKIVLILAAVWLAGILPAANVLVTLSDQQQNSLPANVKCVATVSTQPASVAGSASVIFSGTYFTDAAGSFLVSNAVPGNWCVRAILPNAAPYLFVVPNTNGTLRAENLMATTTNQYFPWSVAADARFAHVLIEGTNNSLANGVLTVKTNYSSGGGSGAALVAGYGLSLTNIGGTNNLSVQTNFFDLYGDWFKAVTYLATTGTVYHAQNSDNATMATYATGSGSAASLGSGALTQVSNIVSTATSGMVTNGLYFYPENYGAQGNGNISGNGSDDTTAIQSAVNAAQLVGGTVFLSSKYYQISNSIIVTNTVTIAGCGISTLGASYLTNGYGVDNLNVPTVAPYLLGSVLVQTSTNTTIICKSLARALNLSNFGILVATNNGYQFASAGGGIFCQALPLGGLSTNDIGIMSSEWKNVYVWGTGSNNFAFYHENGEYNNFTHLESFGCAGFGYLCSMQSPLGNFTLTESDFFCDAPTTLPTISILGTSTSMGYATHILLNRVQALTYQSTQMYLNWRTPNLPFLSNVSAVNPVNTFYVNNAAFVTVNRCAFEDQAAHQRGVVFPFGQGGNVWETASVMGSFPYSVMDNQSWGTITPSIFPDGISFSSLAQDISQHKELIRYLDIPETSGSQYMFGVGLPDHSTVDNFMTPNSSSFSWTWSGWDSNPSGLQTRHILAAIQDGTGNFTNTGSITAGNGFYGDGSHLTGLPSSGISSNNAAGIVSNTVTPSYVAGLGYPNPTNFNHVVVSNNAYSGGVTMGSIFVSSSLSSNYAVIGMASDGMTPIFKGYNFSSNQISPCYVSGVPLVLNPDSSPVGVGKLNPTNTLDVGGTIGDQYGQLPASTSILTTSSVLTASIATNLASSSFTLNLSGLTGSASLTAAGAATLNLTSTPPTTVALATNAITATNAPDGNAIASLNAATNIANAAVATVRTNYLVAGVITNIYNGGTNVVPITYTTNATTGAVTFYYTDNDTITNLPLTAIAGGSSILTNGAAYQPTNANLTTLATLNGNSLTNLNPASIASGNLPSTVTNTAPIASTNVTGNLSTNNMPTNWLPVCVMSAGANTNVVGTGFNVTNYASSYITSGAFTVNLVTGYITNNFAGEYEIGFDFGNCQTANQYNGTMKIYTNGVQADYNKTFQTGAYISADNFRWFVYLPAGTGLNAYFASTGAGNAPLNYVLTEKRLP